MIDYNNLPENIDQKGLENLFSDFLNNPTFNGIEELRTLFDGLFELADRQFYTYQLLNAEIRSKISEFIVDNIVYDDMEIMESILAIIPRLGLKNAFDKIVSNINIIENQQIVDMIKESLEEYGTTVLDPYSGYRK